MTVVFGVVGAAFLFGVFTMLRSRDRGCNGNCIGCTRDSSCKIDGDKR